MMGYLFMCASLQLHSLLDLHVQLHQIVCGLVGPPFLDLLLLRLSLQVDLFL